MNSANIEVKIDSKEQNQNLPILSENKQKFFNRIKIDNSIKEQTKNNILKLLQNKKITDDEFDWFLWLDDELIAFITEWKEIKDIKKHIDVFLISFEKKIFPENLSKKEKTDERVEKVGNWLFIQKIRL